MSKPANGVNIGYVSAVVEVSRLAPAFGMVFGSIRFRGRNNSP